MSLSDAKRIDFEHSWSNHAAKALPRPLRDLWFTFRHTTRLLGNPSKEHALWMIDAEGRFQLLEVIRMVDADLSVTHGMTLTFQRTDKTRFIISERPSRPIPGLDVFFWVPGISEIRWCPRVWHEPGDERVIRVTFNVKTQSNAGQGPQRGAHYISDLKDLIKLYPNELKNI